MFVRMLLSLALIGLNTGAFAQDEDEPIRTTFGMGVGVGLRSLSPEPTIQNYGALVLKYAGKPQPDWFGKYYALDASGEVKEVQFGEFNADGFVRFGVFAENGNGLLFNANYAFSRYSYSYDNIPFQFKGYTLSRRNGDLEAWALQVGAAWYSNRNFFFRLSGLRFQRFTFGGFNRPADDGQLQNYTERGSGFIVGIENRTANKFALVPEIGCTPKEYPVEISFSAIVPFNRSALTERYVYYVNRQPQAEARVSYSSFVVALNLRLGFTVFKTRQKFRPTPKSIRATRQAPPPIHVPPVASRSEFDRLPSDVPLQLKAVTFEQAKADLLPPSYPQLDRLARWLVEHPSARIRLEGHTDLIGDAEENRLLSLRRVVAVKNYLAGRGVASDRVEVKGYGSTQPLNRNCPPPTHCPENRRVELKMLQR